MEDMMQIEFSELAHLYGEYAKVVQEASAAFEESVGEMLNNLRGAAARIVGTELQEKPTTGFPNLRYRYWAIGSFEFPHVWFWANDPAIVHPGRLTLRAWAGYQPREVVVHRVSALKNREDLGPFLDQAVAAAIFSVSVECGEGQDIDMVARRVANLLQALRDVSTAP
jgi:hypothetical protein